MHQRLPNVAHDPAPYRPRWLRLAPFLTHAPALTPRQWQVLGLIAAAYSSIVTTWLSFLLP
jgi:hypothetical protein